MERCSHFITELTRTIPYADSEVIFSYRFQLVDMFPRTQKPVDMFPEPKVRTGRTVDMFLTAIMRTGKGNEYLNGSLVPCGNGSSFK